MVPTPGNPFTPGQRDAVRRALDKVQRLIEFQRRIWSDARTTLAGLSLRGAVLGPLSHEEFRSMDRATVPLPELFSYHRDPAPWEYHPPRGVAIDIPGPTHPPVTPGSERGARKGKGLCSGWADEEDYGPRYEG